MALATAQIVDNSKTIIVSPTASTTLLNEKDDNFLRLYPPSNVAATRMADHIAGKSLKRIAIICDEKNSAFTEDWKHHFEKQFLDRGGEVVDTINLNSNSGQSFLELASQVPINTPSAILILANALDTAMFCQQLSKLDINIPVFASELSMTSGLIHSGGETVEGIEFFHVLSTSSQKKEYLNFNKAYINRFNVPPSYPAILAYDAIKTVLDGLKIGARTGPELKNILLKQESIDTHLLHIDDSKTPCYCNTQIPLKGTRV